MATQKGHKREKSEGNEDGSRTIRIDEDTKETLERLLQKLAPRGGVARQALIGMIVEHFSTLPDDAQAKALFAGMFGRRRRGGGSDSDK